MNLSLYLLSRSLVFSLDPWSLIYSHKFYYVLTSVHLCFDISLTVSPHWLDPCPSFLTSKLSWTHLVPLQPLYSCFGAQISFYNCFRRNLVSRESASCSGQVGANWYQSCGAWNSWRGQFGLFSSVSLYLLDLLCVC